MNIKKLSDGFASNINTDTFERYIQNARVNEELKKMNEEITFEYMKNFLINIFKDNPDYEIFDRKTEIARLRKIVIPSKNSNTIWNENCFAYWNPKNYATFAVFPADEESSKFFNCSFYIFSKGNADYTEHITFANQIDDVRDKIEFYIQSFSFLQTEEEKVNFNDLEIHHNWYTYSNMINHTEDCIKKFDSDKICKKDCLNCNKCKNYYPLSKYTINHYGANMLFNKFIELICKDYKLPVEISQLDNGKFQYNIDNMQILLSLPKRANKQISSASVEIKINNISIYNSPKFKFKNGKELYDLYYELIHWYTPEEKKRIKRKLLKSMLAAK